MLLTCRFTSKRVWQIHTSFPGPFLRLLWSVCASVDEEGRKKIDNYLRELEGSFPNKDTVYEYSVDYKHRSWSPWENRLQSNWKYNPQSVQTNFICRFMRV